MNVWIGAAMTMLLTSCSIQDLESKDLSKNSLHHTPVKAYNMQTINVQCPLCDSVEIFDGFTILKATPINKTWAFLVSKGQLNPTLIATKKGHPPVVQQLEGFEQPIQVNINTQSDSPRSGRLTGIVADTSAHPTGYGIAKVHAATEIILSRGRARQVITTDQDGLFNIALPAGRYNLMVQGKLYTVDVPKDGSTFLPIVLHHKIIN